MQPIGIRPTNDFAFKKTFGSPENKVALISLLNAILTLPVPIVDVTIENPFNLQDFHDDKLSILDIRAVDQRGAIYDVEMQLSAHSGLVKRIVFYGCEVYAGQLKAGDDYSELKPVYSICLLLGQLWDDCPKVHHAFRLVDRDSGRLLNETLEIHTLELGWYNLKESDLETASLLDRWLYWLLHAHQYDAQTLARLFPQPEFQKATDSIDRIAKKTEDKTMYDTREKAIRDQQWILNAARREGREEGREEGELFGRIRLLQKLLGLSQSTDEELITKSSAELDAMATELQAQLRMRMT
ncbi:MAG: Rpn family recombination-promoting nuclease/putative transposase [Planctomycetota bacterium]